MSDFIGLAWPLLVGIVIIYFRKEIKAALSRITEIGPTGFKLDTAATAQQIATTPATANVLISNIKQAISADQLTPALNQVKKELLSQSQNKDEQIDILSHALAALNVQLSHERNYRNIFGSQMNALVRMNNPGGATPEILKQFYDAAATQYPELYKNVTFENWTAFLVTSGLAVQTDDRYQTTPFGSGFLKYVLDMHLITPKPY